MPRSNRLPYIALRGHLIAVILLGFANSILAQEAEKQSVPSNQTEQAQPEKAEPAEASALVSAEQEQPPPRVERGPQYDPDYYAEADLDAQRRMAVGTERIVEFTWWQTVVIGIEAALLVFTLCFTALAAIAAAKAARAADASVKIASETAERQLRAYVHPAKTKVSLGADGMVRASVPFENTGQTPAYQLTSWMIIGTAPYPLTIELPVIPPDARRSSQTVLRAGGKITIDIQLPEPVSVKDQKIIASGKGAIFIYGYAKYRDTFGKERTTNLRLMYQGPWGGTKQPVVCQEGNDAD